MTKKQISDRVIKNLGRAFQKSSFSSSFRDQAFVKETPDAFVYYQFLIYDRTVLKTGEKGYLIEPYVWIHVKDIEKYYRQITLNTYLKRNIDFKTIGNSVAEIISNPDHVHKVRNKSLDLLVWEEKDLEYLYYQLFESFSKVALPYFDTNGAVLMIDKLANDIPEKSSVHFRNDNQRVVKALIAAKLNNNPALEDLIRIYGQVIDNWKMYDQTRAEFEAVKSILPTIV